MKEKQYLLTTEIYLFLALGGLILIYGCCIELTEAGCPLLQVSETRLAEQIFQKQQQRRPRFHLKSGYEYSYI